MQKVEFGSFNQITARLKYISAVPIMNDMDIEDLTEKIKDARRQLRKENAKLATLTHYEEELHKKKQSILDEKVRIDA